MTQVDAYRKCYPDQSPTSVNAHAHELAKKMDVKSRVAEIKEMVDSQFAMTLGEKRDILRRMIEGQIPTKVIRKADGKIDAIFDRMAALQMDAKIGGEFAPDQLQIQSQGPTLKLDFQVLGRNTRLSPAMEAEWKQMKAGPEVRELPEAPAGQQEDFSEYLEAEVRPHKIKTLDSMKPIIDITPEEAS